MTRAISAVVYAKDMPLLAAFYETVLQLRRDDEDGGFVVLGSNAVELVIVQTPAHIAEQIEITEPPAVREDTPIKLSFKVAAIEPLRAPIAAAGGALKSPEAAWSWRGDRHLDGWDPEGNVFQLRENTAS